MGLDRTFNCIDAAIANHASPIDATNSRVADARAGEQTWHDEVVAMRDELVKNDEVVKTAVVKIEKVLNELIPTADQEMLKVQTRVTATEGALNALSEFPRSLARVAAMEQTLGAMAHQEGKTFGADF